MTDDFRGNAVAALDQHFHDMARDVETPDRI
jgi:hypothetical protein